MAWSRRRRRIHGFGGDAAAFAAPRWTGPTRTRAKDQALAPLSLQLLAKRRETKQAYVVHHDDEAVFSLALFKAGTSLAP